MYILKIKLYKYGRNYMLRGSTNLGNTVLRKKTLRKHIILLKFCNRIMTIFLKKSYMI